MVVAVAIRTIVEIGILVELGEISVVTEIGIVTGVMVVDQRCRMVAMEAAAMTKVTIAAVAMVIAMVAMDRPATTQRTQLLPLGIKLSRTSPSRVIWLRPRMG